MANIFRNYRGNTVPLSNSAKSCKEYYLVSVMVFCDSVGLEELSIFHFQAHPSSQTNVELVLLPKATYLKAWEQAWKLHARCQAAGPPTLHPVLSLRSTC